jgi:hypothetical protein
MAKGLTQLHRPAARRTFCAEASRKLDIGVSGCRAKAIQLLHDEDMQVGAEIEALLAEEACVV